MDERLKTGLTLIATLAVTVLMAVWGFNAMTAPFPKAATAEVKQCKNERIKKRLFRKEVQVSVYNASSRSGLAGSTMEKLVGQGFIAGDPGNAPDGVRVRRVQVWAKTEGSEAALLVAKAFQPEADVVVSDDPLGPGVDVMIGPRAKFKAKSPSSIKLAKPIVTCLD